MSVRAALSSRPAEARVVAAVTAAAVAVFACSWLALHHGFYTRKQLVDTQRYWVYGAAVTRGFVPYRDYPLEYPPGALPAFVLPAVGHDRPEEYRAFRSSFEGLMLLCGCLTIVFMGVVLRAVGAAPGRVAAALGFAALTPLALGSVVLSRFDLYPVAITAGAMAAACAGRRRLSSGVLALGAATKLYPILILPLVLADAWRRSGRREATRCGAVFVGVLAAVVAPFVVLSPGGTWSALSGQASRPLQIESLGSAVLLVAHRAVGSDVSVTTSHGSQNVVGSLADAVAALQSVLLAVVLVALWVAYARRPATQQRFLRFAAAAVCAYVALGKVVSPQYLTWLVPLVPLVRGRRGVTASILLGFALVLTQLWFPFHYWDLARRQDGRIAFLVLDRDLVLVALLVVLAWPFGRVSAAFDAPAPAAAPRRPR